MINIIVKHADLSITRIIPNAKKYSNDNIADCKTLQYFINQGLDWFICQSEDLPDKKTLESRSQWYWEGNQVKADQSWEVVLMPIALIKKKHISRIDSQIDAALAEGTAPLNVIRLQREKEICMKWDENRWHEQALINLDKRVQNGEPDKPIIREKLIAKIR